MLKTGIFFLSLVLSSCGELTQKSETQEAWNDDNTPEKFERFNGRVYDAKFSNLPVKAELTNKPWSGDYWPTYKGGISYRWNGDPGLERVKYNSLSKSEVFALSYDELKKLSPAEKYDIYRGAYNFPLVEAERIRTEVLTKSDIPTWEGLCHGWAPATIHFQDPSAVTMTNSDGLDIPFGSSDIKALLTRLEHHDMVELGKGSRQIGKRCEFDSYGDYLASLPDGMSDLFSEEQIKNFYKQSGCADENAGAFHIVITNQIGLQDEGFVVDVTYGAEVWNQAVNAYEYEIVKTFTGEEISETAAPGTAKEVEVSMIMTYTTEVAQSWEKAATYFSDGYDLRNGKKYYTYRLELSKEGTIIGGSWVSTSRPDFWTIRKKPVFDGDYSALGAIYRASVSQN